MINIITEDGTKLINYDDVSVIHIFTLDEKRGVIKIAFRDNSELAITDINTKNELEQKFQKLCNAIANSPIGNVIIDMRTL